MEACPAAPELTCVCSAAAVRRRRPPAAALLTPLLPARADQLSRPAHARPCRIQDLPDDVLEHVFVLAGQQY